MKSALFILIAIASFSTYIQSQSCEECKQRSIILYDNEVQVPAPDSAATVEQTLKAYQEWTNLFYIAGGVKNAVWQDPETDCFQKMSAAFFTEPDSVNTSIKFGVGFPNLPPAGSAGGNTDYLIYGIVTGGNGSYTLQLKLETAKSREAVKGVTVNFTSADDPIQVGQNAAAHFSPLYSTIMEFEKKKRDEGEPYAIRPKIEAVPEKKVIQKNESTNVEFTLKDCDDQPLKDRTIELTSENGTFDKETVTTDGSGKATAVFTAGMESGIAKVQGTLQYRMPTDISSVSPSDGGDAYIQIEKQPYWQLLARFSRTHTSESKDQSPNTSSKTEWVSTHQTTIKAFLDMASALPGTYYTNNVVMFNTLGGSYHFQLAGTSNMVVENYGYSNERSTSNCFGGYDPKSDKVKLWVSFGSREVNIQFSIPANVSGDGFSEEHSWDRINGYQSSSSTTECDGIEMGGYDFHAKYDEDTTYTKVDRVENPALGYVEESVLQVMRFFKGQDGVYVFGYDGQDVTTTTMEMSGVSSYTQVKINTELFGEIITDKATAVEDDPETLPEEYALFQNYPNPFNPITTINYQLPEPGVVNLKVYDIVGQEVSTLVESYRPAGLHIVRFDASNLNSGIYFYKLRAGDKMFLRKMLLLK